MYRNKLLLYSVNSWLSYKIAEHYFENKHYCWCSPYFDASNVNPSSSNPIEIYASLKRDVESKDSHSSKISQIKAGLIKGASEKLKAGVINTDQEKEIIDIVNAAEISDFRPLIYVIPTYKVLTITQPVSVSIKANTFSQEYIIEALDKEMFDVIYFEGRL